jgi:hypothetical protein
MAGSNRTILAIFVALLVVAAGLVAWWFTSRDSPESVVDQVPPPTPAPTPLPTPTLDERLSERLAGATLATSDSVVAELVGQLSANPQLASWLVNEDLVRRFTAGIDNIASGISPRSHFEFLRPKEGFEVDEQPGGELTIEPSSYQRYDLVAEVVSSLNTEGTVRLYRELEPLVDEAYAEIGPRNAKFSDRLDAAFDQLLAVPVLDGTAEVEQLVLTYAWADDELEAMSDVQRHLLRMGPDNVSKIQAKLGELRAALSADATE